MYTQSLTKGVAVTKTSFGARLKRIREKRGFTQEDVATAAKVSGGKQMISNWENGASTPRAEYVAALASAMLTNTDYLLGLTEDDRPLPARLTDEQLEVIELWDELKRRGK